MKRLVLVVFGMAVALAAVELGLRWSGPLVDPAAANPWIGCVGWAGQPHQRLSYHTDEFTTTELINSAGLPDVEHSYAKPRGVFRILILGDSFVEAYQVNLQQSFPRLLEDMLNQNRTAGDPRFEVIKAGYRSWGTDQQWLYFQCEGYKYSPDLVLLSFTVNDVVDNYLPLKAKMAGWSEATPPKPYYALENDQLVQYNFPFPPPPDEVRPETLPDWLYKHTVTYRVAEKGWHSLRLRVAEMGLSQASRNPSDETAINRYPTHPMRYTLPVYIVPVPPEYEQAWQLTDALLASLHRQVTDSGADFAVFSNSHIWSVHPSVLGEIGILDDPVYQDAAFDWQQPVWRLAGTLTKMGVPWRLLDPDFVEYVAAHNDQRLFFREGHWNEEGHILAAELLYRWLVEQHLIP